MTVDLPPRLLQIYRELDGKGDVDWDALYRKAFGAEPPENVQNFLGPYITRLNRRLKTQRVIPGAKKRTYRLTSVD